jgi:hypothetical protein
MNPKKGDSEYMYGTYSVMDFRGPPYVISDSEDRTKVDEEV